MLLKRRAGFLSEVVRLDIIEERRCARSLLLLGPFGAVVAAAGDVDVSKAHLLAPGISVALAGAKPAPFPGAAWTVRGDLYLVQEWPLRKGTRQRLADTIASRGLEIGEYAPCAVDGWPAATLLPGAGDEISYAIGGGTLRVLDANGRLWSAPIKGTAATEDESEFEIADAA